MGSIRVVLDGCALGRRKTGNETYIRGLLEGFEQLGDDAPDVSVITTPLCPQPQSPRFAWHQIPLGNLVTRNFWRIPRLLRRSGADLYHAHYWSNVWKPFPYVVTIHDISFVSWPAGFKPHERVVSEQLIRRAARKARHIITVSHFSKQELVERWRIPPDRITVTYAGLDSRFRPAPDRRPSDPYILYVGNLHPRKNLVRLIDAFVLLKREYKSPARLVVVGQAASGANDAFDAARKDGITQDIDFTGFVDETQLVSLYQQATVTALPSLYEGFGLPMLEAMACGSPVVASNTTSLPEVVGDAGFLVDPTSVNEIADALNRIVSSDDVQADLRSRGLARARSFSWERMARETAAVYRTAVG